MDASFLLAVRRRLAGAMLTGACLAVLCTGCASTRPWRLASLGPAQP